MSAAPDYAAQEHKATTDEVEPRASTERSTQPLHGVDADAVDADAPAPSERTTAAFSPPATAPQAPPSESSLRSEPDAPGASGVVLSRLEESGGVTRVVIPTPPSTNALGAPAPSTPPPQVAGRVVPFREITQDVPVAAVEAEEPDADWFEEVMRQSVRRPIAPQVLAKRPKRETPPVASPVASLAQRALRAAPPSAPASAPRAAAPPHRDRFEEAHPGAAPPATPQPAPFPRGEHPRKRDAHRSTPSERPRRSLRRRHASSHRGGAPALFVSLYAAMATASVVILQGGVDLAHAAGRHAAGEAALSLWWADGRVGPVAVAFAAVVGAITVCWGVGRWAAGSSFSAPDGSARFTWSDVASALLLGTAAGVPAVLIVGACATGGELRPFVEAVEQVSLAPFLGITWPWWIAAALAYWACQTCAARMVWREHGWRTTALSTLPWACAWAVGTLAGVVSSV